MKLIYRSKPATQAEKRGRGSEAASEESEEKFLSLLGTFLVRGQGREGGEVNNGRFTNVDKVNISSTLHHFGESKFTRLHKLIS